MIELVSTPHLTEMKENAFFRVRSLVAYFDKCAPLFRVFVGGKVTIVLATTPPEMLESRVVPPGLSLIAMLSMVLPTQRGLSLNS